MERANRSFGNPTDMKFYGLFPSVSYFQFAALHGEIALFSHFEQAHYDISGANQIETLRIPLTHETKKNANAFWQISYEHKWLREHQNALRTAYGKSPFYEYYDYKIWGLLNQKITSFKSLHESIIKLILPWIGLEELPLIDLESNESRHYFRSLEKTTYFEYTQVFESKFGHRKNISIIDLLFNIGPECASYFRQ